VVISNTACDTDSTSFLNAANIISSLSGGYYQAGLADEMVGGTYNFCVNIWAATKFKSVTGLNFVVHECLATTITSTVTTETTQTVLLSSADKRFKIAEYTQTDPLCLAVY